MAVLVGRRLEEAHGREVAHLEGRPEVGHVVLVVGAAVIRGADDVGRTRTHVLEVGRREVILERLVVRDVVGALDVDERRGGDTAAAGRAVGILGGQVEATFEEAPADVLGVEQVADVLARHQRGRVLRVRADVAGRVEVADHRPVAVAVGNDAAAVIGAVLLQRIAVGQDHAVGLAGDEIDGARRRGAEGGRIGVVAHGEVLGVVPQRGDGVAVVVAHHQTLRAEGAGAALGAAAGVQREEVHGEVVIGRLLGGVAVVLVGGAGLGDVEAEGLGRVGAVGGVGLVGVAGQEVGAGERVDVGGCVRGRREFRLTGRIGRFRIGGEVVVERDVLLEDHDKMLDRCRG